AIRCAGLVAGHKLSHDRNVRQHLQARRTGYCEGSHLAGFDVLLRRRYYAEDAMHLSADQIRPGIAPIMDKSKIDTGHQFEKFASEVHRGPATRRGHIDLAWIGFRIGDELGNGFGRKRWIDHHDKGCAANNCDWRDVANEIKVKFLVERSV